MAAALKSQYISLIFGVYLFSFALAQNEINFSFNGFSDSDNVDAFLQLDGMANIQSSGILQLTSSSSRGKGYAYAFYSEPLDFRSSISFSTHFVFATVPKVNNSGGHGIAFFYSSSTDFSRASAADCFGIFEYPDNDGLSQNSIFAVELDTVQTLVFDDIDGNHVGIDVNSSRSKESAPAAYFSEKEGKNISLDLASGNPIQIWIDYNGTTNLLNVTLAPITVPKPNKPLLSIPLDLSQIFFRNNDIYYCSYYVGFSASTGTINKSDHYILGWSFSNTGQEENLNISKLPPLPIHSSSSEPIHSSSSEKPGAGLIVIISLAAAAVVLITIGASVYIIRKKKYEEVYEDWEKEYAPQRYTYTNLYKATKGFNDKQVVGQGGFGKVYRGVLPSNELIAVKRISHDSKQGVKEFVAEVVSMGKLRHRNLVKLRGYCRLRREFLLVYDYMPNGSLDKILYSNTRPNLNWSQRFRIIRGVASGLFYLHEDWEQVVLHRDIKPANVLLDNDLNGRLGDFGLARLYDHGSSLQTTNLVGTFGYMAPELMRTGKASTNTDVYAFGVFMLEVACGRRPIEPQARLPETVSLIDWVNNCWKREAIVDACDTRLETLYAEEQMELVLKLGLLCSHTNPAARPSMRQVMQYLDGEVMLPDITPEGFEITTTNETSGCEISSSSLTVDSILTEGR